MASNKYFDTEGWDDKVDNSYTSSGNKKKINHRERSRRKEQSFRSKDGSYLLDKDGSELKCYPITVRT